MGGVANRLRKKRMRLFEHLFSTWYKDELAQGKTIRVLDLGGTYEYWKAMEFRYFDRVDITLANVLKTKVPEDAKNVRGIIADATNLRDIADQSFDLVYSNSCIEHVGKEPEWEKMAREIKRTGSHFFLQTPNRYFPIEPHFLFPLFQFFPLRLRAFFIHHFQLGFWPRGKTWEQALSIADEIKLLRYKDLRRLFPEAEIAREKVFGLTKSFMCYH